MAKEEISAVGVMGSTVSYQEAGAGSRPSAALQAPAFGPRDLLVRPLPAIVARRLCQEIHYLHSYPGAALINLGIFRGNRLMVDRASSARFLNPPLTVEWRPPALLNNPPLTADAVSNA